MKNLRKEKNRMKQLMGYEYGSRKNIIKEQVSDIVGGDPPADYNPSSPEAKAEQIFLAAAGMGTDEASLVGTLKTVSDKNEYAQINNAIKGIIKKEGKYTECAEECDSIACIVVQEGEAGQEDGWDKRKIKNREVYDIYKKLGWSDTAIPTEFPGPHAQDLYANYLKASAEVLGCTGDIKGSWTMESEMNEETDRLKDLMGYKTSKVLCEQTILGEQEVRIRRGDPYEYQTQDGAWHTRKKGSEGRWIDISADKFKNTTDILNREFPDDTGVAATPEVTTPLKNQEETNMFTKWVSDTYDDAVDDVKDGWDKYGDPYLQKTKDIVKDKVKQAEEIIPDAPEFDFVPDWMVQNYKVATDKLKEKASEVKKDITDVSDNTIDSFLNWGSDLIQSGKEVASDVVSTGKEYAKAGVEKVKGVASAVGEKLDNALDYVGGAFVSALRKASPTLMQYIYTDSLTNKDFNNLHLESLARATGKAITRTGKSDLGATEYEDYGPNIASVLDTSGQSLKDFLFMAVNVARGGAHEADVWMATTLGRFTYTKIGEEYKITDNYDFTKGGSYSITKEDIGDWDNTSWVSKLSKINESNPSAGWYAAIRHIGHLDAPQEVGAKPAKITVVLSKDILASQGVGTAGSAAGTAAT